jgi:hypothetical protein
VDYRPTYSGDNCGVITEPHNENIAVSSAMDPKARSTQTDGGTQESSSFPAAIWWDTGYLLSPLKFTSPRHPTLHCSLTILTDHIHHSH